MSAKIATPDKNCLRCKGTGLMTIAQYGTIASCRCIYEERTERGPWEAKLADYGIKICLRSTPNDDVPAGLLDRMAQYSGTWLLYDPDDGRDGFALVGDDREVLSQEAWERFSDDRVITGRAGLEPLKCPKCGNDGSSHPIFYLEEVTASRRVLGVKDGVVQIDANFKTSDEGAQQRFECSGCPDEAGTGPFTWVVPDSTDIEWV